MEQLECKQELSEQLRTHDLQLKKSFVSVLKYKSHELSDRTPGFLEPLSERSCQTVLLV